MVQGPLSSHPDHQGLGNPVALSLVLEEAFGGSLWQEQKQKCSRNQGSSPKTSRKCLTRAHKLGHMLSPGATEVQVGAAEVALT